MDPPPQVADPRPFVVFGVSGGIAAYKACEVLRRLTETGHRVRVVPTDAALSFVGAPTWAALSGEPVATDVWTDAHEVPHVRLGRAADLVLVAPATANLLARAAAGRADDLLTSTLLTATCPVVLAAAMHTEMWEHAATRANVATLRSRGVVVLDPAVGRLTGADTGKGRLAEPEEIARVVRSLLARGPAAAVADLAGRRVVVSAGGTREYLDPVRFLGNRSSGRQGYAFARTAAARGAAVTLVSANVGLPDPAGVDVVRVVSAQDLRDAVVAAAAGADVPAGASAGASADAPANAPASAPADVVVMAAAVADFRPIALSARKIKKTGEAPASIELVENPDVLAELGHTRRPGQVLVGFAAETNDALANGRQKLVRKGCDLLVVNEVGYGRGFEVEHNTAVVLHAGGAETPIPSTSKDALADTVWDLVVERLRGES